MTCQLNELNVSGQVGLFNKRVVFRLRIPNTFTKQVRFRLIHLAEYSWLDSTRIRPTNTNCHPYNQYGINISETDVNALQ